MALDVKVTISLLKAIGSLGWGYPLILSKSTTDIAYTECESLDEVVTAGFAATTDTYKAAEVMFAQKNPPAKIAVCGLATVDATNLATLTGKGWRHLVTVGEDITQSVVATYVAGTTDKMYFTGVSATADIATKVNSESDRVVVVVHSTKADLAAAAVAGEVAGNTVGSITYKNLVIKGIDAENLSETAITAIHTAHAITLLEKAGDVVTSEGFVMSGEYADIIDCKDYIISQLTYKTQKLLNNTGKIPYDDKGIGLLENIAVDVMKDAYSKGMIAEDENGEPIYTVSYALRSEQDEGDIEKRKYIGGRFAFTLAGAIHTVDVKGEISVI